MCEEVEGIWEKLKYDNEYEIYSEHPYPVRRIKTCHIVSEVNKNGYIKLKISGNYRFKHRLIALQWLENDDPDNKIICDHINRNSLDNRIENLRWLTHSDSNKNRKQFTKRNYEYLDEMPSNVIEIVKYNDFEFSGYFFDIDAKIILKVQNNERIKVVQYYLKNGTTYISLIDTDKKIHGFRLQKLLNHLNTIE